MIPSYKVGQRFHEVKNGCDRVVPHDPGDRSDGLESIPIAKSSRPWITALTGAKKRDN
jgi:hypothetical protein